MPKSALITLCAFLGVRCAWYLWIAYRWRRSGQAWGAWSQRGRS